MFDLLIISAALILACFAMHVVASVAITYRDSQNAADIISAMGNSFPLKSIWSRRK